MITNRVIYQNLPIHRDAVRNAPSESRDPI